jgi:hypothetical protein
MRSPSVRADMSKIEAFRRASEVKKHSVEVEKANIISTKPSEEQSTRRKTKTRSFGCTFRMRPVDTAIEGSSSFHARQEL